MKSREEIFKEIEIYSTGIEGYSPYIIDLLKNIERDFSYVEDIYISRISKAFNVTEEEILSTVKLLGIKLKEKNNYKEIKVCLGRSCTMVNGSEAILDRFKDNLGIDVDELTKDGKIKLTTQRCFGRCGIGPNVKVGDEIKSNFNLGNVAYTIKKLKGSDK